MNWKAIDWTKSSTQISNETGKQIAIVSQQRRYHAPHTLHKAIAPPSAKRFSVPLKDLRRMKVKPLITVGEEKLNIARLKGCPKETVVVVSQSDFDTAWMRQGREILAGFPEA